MTMSSVSPSPSPSPTDSSSTQLEAKGSLGSKSSCDDTRLPFTDDEAYREILEQCRDFYTFENSSMSFLQPNQLLPRLEDSIMMIEQKRKAKVCCASHALAISSPREAFRAKLTNQLIAAYLSSTVYSGCPEEPMTPSNKMTHHVRQKGD